MSIECEECVERECCEWALEIGDFLKHLTETHSIHVIHECPFHYDLDVDKPNMERLKPCPFCFGTAEIERRQDHSMNVEHKIITSAERYKIRCRNCGCGTYWAFYEENAIAAWNRRAEAPGGGSWRF